MIFTELLIGKREIVSYGIESVAYGTRANPTIILKNAVVTPKDTEDWQEIQGVGTDTLAIAKAVGNKVRGFDLTYTPQDWRFLNFVCGQCALTGSYVHTWADIGTRATHKSFTLERKISHSTLPYVRTYTGCKVNSATISFNIGGGGATGKFISLNADCIAQDITVGTTAYGTPAASSLVPFQAKYAALYLNGTKYAYVLSGSITIENNPHDAVYALADADGKTSEMQPTIKRIHGSFTVHSIDNSIVDLQYNRVIAPTGSGTNRLEIVRTASTDLASFTFTNLRLKTSEPTVLNGAIITSVDWDADEVAIVATDAIAAYLDEI